MRQAVASVAEIAGSIAIIIGAAQVSTAAGWVTAGVVSLVFAWRLS